MKNYQIFLCRILEDNRALSYEDFINELTKLLIQFYSERINYYIMTGLEHFRSNWVIIQCNSTIFVGYMLRNLSPEVRKVTTLNPGIVTDALIVLLKDKNSTVRVTAANSMAFLSSY